MIAEAARLHAAASPAGSRYQANRAANGVWFNTLLVRALVDLVL